MINYNHTVVVFLLLSLGIFKLGSCTENQSQTNNVTVKCIQSEREALVRFKAGVIDFPGKLSSWVSEDCCQWKGVECDETDHVIKLNLSNPAGRHRHPVYDRSDDNCYDGSDINYPDLAYENNYPVIHLCTNANKRIIPHLRRSSRDSKKSSRNCKITSTLIHFKILNYLDNDFV